MKFRKKPVVIEAMQFDGTHESACLIDGWSVGQVQAQFDYVYAGPNVSAKFNGHIVVHTLEGDMVGNAEDWVIQGVKGEFYPCKPNIFQASYESVEDIY
jgi:hypothetical protein